MAIMTSETVPDPVAAGLGFDPYDYGFHADPYPVYARLRAQAPLHWNKTGGFWAVSRHADVQAVLRDDVTFSNRMGVSLDASAWNPEAHRVMSFLALDGDAQKRLRRLVSAAFTPRRVKELEPQVARLTDKFSTGTSFEFTPRKMLPVLPS
jgi:cytochrome P450